jgi:molecular chaperone DnaK
MIRQAEEFSGEDKKRRGDAEKLNNADAICYQAERTLADFGDKISEDLRKRIQSALTDSKDAVAKKEPDQAAQKAEVLKSVLQEVGQAVYAQAGEAGPQPRPDVGEPTGEARPSGSGGARVVDAQYREAGDDKR